MRTKEQIKEQNARAYQKGKNNPEYMAKRKASQSKYYQNNKESVMKTIADWQNSHKEQMLEAHLIYSRSMKGRLNNYKARARKQGYECTLTVEFLEELAESTPVCPMLGIELVYEVGKKLQHNIAHLDRIDNTKGYVQGNVHFISARANILKNNSSLDELKNIVQYLTDINR